MPKENKFIIRIEHIENEEIRNKDKEWEENVLSVLREKFGEMFVNDYF